MITYCSRTDVGGREKNEDACLTYAIDHPSGKLHLLAVADGLGGHHAGEIASKLAIMELRETVIRSIGNYDKITLEVIRELLANAYRKANEEVCYQAKIIPEMHGMGTTLVAALLDDEGKGWVANVGDSRGYLIGNGIQRVTKDHSYVQELVDKGVISQEEAATHPEKNVVTKIIGIEGVEPNLFDIEVDKDTLLLCSDGLTDGLKEEEITQIVEKSEIENICRNLVESAKVKSKDNITTIAVKKSSDFTYIMNETK